MKRNILVLIAFTKAFETGDSLPIRARSSGA